MLHIVEMIPIVAAGALAGGILIMAVIGLTVPRKRGD